MAKGRGNRIDDVGDLSQKAAYGRLASHSHIFANPTHHRYVAAYLFTTCLTAAAPEEAVAGEFWRAYRHLAEGGAVADLPLKILDREDVVGAIRRILRGDLAMLDDEFQGDDNDNGSGDD